jgi:hypothetical protein
VRAISASANYSETPATVREVRGGHPEERRAIARGQIETAFSTLALKMLDHPIRISASIKGSTGMAAGLQLN